jgi:hypothetical protein
MKHLLPNVAIVALLAVFAPAWAQNPAQTPANQPNSTAAAPSTGPAPAASEKSGAPMAPEFADKTPAKAGNWVRPKRQQHQVRRSHRYARYRSPRYGSPYYWDYRWMSPADHMANQLNAGVGYGGWGWGYAPYHDSYN